MNEGMNSFIPGKAYVLLGMPLWVRGVVWKEDVRFVWLTKESAEELPDAQNLAQYTEPARSPGTKIGRPYAAHKDSLIGFIPID